MKRTNDDLGALGDVLRSAYASLPVALPFNPKGPTPTPAPQAPEAPRPEPDHAEA